MIYLREVFQRIHIEYTFLNSKGEIVKANIYNTNDFIVRRKL